MNISVIAVISNVLIVISQYVFSYLKERQSARSSLQMKHYEHFQEALSATLSSVCENYARLKISEHADNVWKLYAAIYRLQALLPSSELQSKLSLLASSIARWKCTTSESDQLLSEILITLPTQCRQAQAGGEK